MGKVWEILGGFFVQVPEATRFSRSSLRDSTAGGVLHILASLAAGVVSTTVSCPKMGSGSSI